MRLLVVGSGGREQALAWKIAQSSDCDRLFVAPGNGGGEGERVIIAVEEVASIVRFAKDERIDLVVIGPEAPLIAGMADALREERILAFGPSARAAQIEGSKALAKRLMAKAGIPTAESKAFQDGGAAKDHLRQRFSVRKQVVKADVPALGKGVIVPESLGDAEDAVDQLLAISHTIVIEDRLEGREASLIVISDGERAAALPMVRDYKRALDDDRGPNTGGMGAYSPLPDVSAELAAECLETCVQQILKTMRDAGEPFAGALFAGLMLTDDGPMALEYNCRFGDPETQALMPLVDGDLLPLLVGSAEGRLPKDSVTVKRQASVCVTIASGGYPGEYKKGFPIEGLEEAARVPGALIFHAGTERKDGRIVTNGGRVLSIVGVGSELTEARKAAYEAAGKIHFEGAYYRSDIAASV
ncbi:MAG: phosphoribosylamine--glycine ligase [Armatimonadetes bacterium]|nr:phosphoribosylamine--glycine ligase [Armatimonadota bacterium]